MKKFSTTAIAKAKSRGALFVEYALLLAFVVLVGAHVISADGMQSPIKSIIASTESLLGSATSKENALPSFSSLAKNQYWASGAESTGTVSGELSGSPKMFATGERITLGPGTYEFSWDYQKFGDTVGSDASKVRLGIMGYDADNKLIFDPGVDGSKQKNLVPFSQNGTVKTYKVTVEKETSFGVNFDAFNCTDAQGNKNGYNYNGASDDKLNQAIQSSLTVKKVND